MKNSTLFMLIVLILNLGCVKEPLAPLSMQLDSVMGYGKVDAHFCTSPPSPAKQKLKYLFILDHSASNKPDIPSPLTPMDTSNTDPQGGRRYGPMVDFIQNLNPDPTSVTSFGLLDFNDNISDKVGTGVSGTSSFDPDAMNFIATVNKDWIGGGTKAAPSPNDSGFTDYKKALNAALAIINQDAKLESISLVAPIVTTNYQIIFVSDGVPTIATPGGSTPTYTQTFMNDISPVIDALENIKNDPTIAPYVSGVTLNTAYYANQSNEIAAAETLLQQMAQAGNGQYLQFTSGQNILYQEFAPPSRNIRNQLTDVFVENVNGVWWDDGRFMADSDGDGLPDLIELQMGSNPYLKDSDGNGVSDLVEYRTKGKPCADTKCAAALRDSYAICDGLSPSTDASGVVTFPYSTNDGLNDCEKYVLGASRVKFNSNGNLIPDLLALKNSLPVIAGSANRAFADPFADGTMNYMKLKSGLPIQVSAKTIPDFLTRVTSLTAETSPSPNLDCYHLQVDNVALSGPTNRIKVMLVQNSSAVQDKPFLMGAEAAIDQTKGSVSFSPGDFK